MDQGGREAEIRTRLADITGPEPGPDERALLARLIRSYLSKTPAGVERLGELLRSGSLDDVRDQAHSLKGSAANLGAHALAGVFAEVEHGARDGTRAEPEVALSRVGAELALAETVLHGLAAEFEQ